MRKFVSTYAGRLSASFSRHGLLYSLLIGSCLRLVGLGYECLWYDEAFTSLISDLPLSRALPAIAGDVHPPLYYLITWIMGHTIGNNAITMRLPAAIFGILSILQIYRLSLAAGLGPKLAPYVSLAMALLPVQLYYSQEARQYTVLTFLVLFTMTSILRGQWLRSVLALPLLLYAHNLAFIYAAPLGLWLVWKARRRVLRYLPLCLAYLPQLAVTVRQAADIQDGFWIPAYGPGQLVFQMVFTTFGFRLPSWLIVHASIITVLLTVLSIWTLRKERWLWSLLAFGFLPPLIMYAVSVAWKPITLERALLPSGVMLTILWVAGVARLPRWSKLPIALPAGAVLLLSLVSFVVIDRDDFASVAQDLQARIQPGDAVYHTNIPSVIFLGRYMDMSSGNHYALPAIGDLNQSLSDETKQAMGIKQIEVPIERLHELGYQRAWLLRTITPASNQTNLDRVQAIIDDYEVLQSLRMVDQEFGKFDVFLIDLGDDYATAP